MTLLTLPRPAQRKPAVLASITFPPVLYTTLEEIAQLKEVSLARVVREAAEKCTAEKCRLLEIGGHSPGANRWLVR